VVKSIVFTVTVARNGNGAGKIELRFKKWGKKEKKG
jgi:hypothetical protein